MKLMHTGPFPISHPRFGGNQEEQDYGNVNLKEFFKKKNYSSQARIGTFRTSTPANPASYPMPAADSFKKNTSSAEQSDFTPPLTQTALSRVEDFTEGEQEFLAQLKPKQDVNVIDLLKAKTDLSNSAIDVSGKALDNMKILEQNNKALTLFSVKKEELQAAQQSQMAEQIKLQNKANVTKMTLMGIQSTFTYGLAATLPAFAPLIYAGSMLLKVLSDVGINVVFRPENYKKIKTKISSAYHSAKSTVVSFKNKFMSFFGMGGSSVKFGTGTPSRSANPSAQAASSSSANPSTVFNTLSNFINGLGRIIERQEAAVQQQDPEAFLRVQKDLMANAKQVIDTIGSDKDKQKVYKAEQVSKHYDLFIDALDTNNSNLTFADIPEATQKHLQLALFHALTSQDETLVTWGKDYARQLGIVENVVENIMKNGQSGGKTA